MCTNQNKMIEKVSKYVSEKSVVIEKKAHESQKTSKKTKMTNM